MHANLSVNGSEDTRFGVTLLVAVTSDQHSFVAKLVNLSRSGARIQTDQSLAPGSPFKLDVAGWPQLLARDLE